MLPSNLPKRISSPHDLHEVRVATVGDSTSSKFLTRERISFFSYGTVEQCLDKLVAEKIDAVVYDAAMLQYLYTNKYQDKLTVLPSTFEKQDYALALPAGSPLRETINQALLEKLADPNWLEIVHRYLGSSVE